MKKIKMMKFAALLVIFGTLLAAFPVEARAVTVETAVTAPKSVNEGEFATVSFSVKSNSAMAAQLQLSVTGGGSLVSMSASEGEVNGAYLVIGGSDKIKEVTGTALIRVESAEKIVVKISGDVSSVIDFSFSNVKKTVEIKVKASAVPVNMKLTAKNSLAGIELSWSKGKGCSSYDIYRAPKGGSYQLLTNVSGTAWTDRGAAFGTEYTYKVVGRSRQKEAARSHAEIVVRNPFKDVKPENSYYRAVGWAFDNSIVSGTSADTFSPLSSCTRYQFAVMLYKLAGRPQPKNEGLDFTDVSPSDSFYNAVRWAFQQGIISGTTESTFSPQQPIKRYQVVQMLYKMAGRPAVSGKNPFTDVSSRDSYYKAVMWAAQKGITSGTTKTSFSPQAECQRYQMVVFLSKYNDIYRLK